MKQLFKRLGYGCFALSVYAFVTWGFLMIGGDAGYSPAVIAVFLSLYLFFTGCFLLMASL